MTAPSHARAAPEDNRSKKSSSWFVVEGDGPLVATAIHDGHGVRREIAARLALSPAERLREEDPHTGGWTAMAPNRIVVRKSRFEVDLNRPRERAVYLESEDAWGLPVWKRGPPPQEAERSLALYDAFYAEAERLLSRVRRRFGCFVVFDLHTYNHRRSGPAHPPVPPEANPEINLGTGTLDRERWAPVVDRFLRELRGFDFLGRQLDVRENVKFRGGQFPRWIHRSFPETGCALAIEVKKWFMDEWTGRVDREQWGAIGRALGSVVPGVLDALEGLSSRPGERPSGTKGGRLAGR